MLPGGADSILSVFSLLGGGVWPQLFRTFASTHTYHDACVDEKLSHHVSQKRKVCIMVHITAHLAVLNASVSWATKNIERSHSPQWASHFLALNPQGKRVIGTPAFTGVCLNVKTESQAPSTCGIRTHWGPKNCMQQKLLCCSRDVCIRCSTDVSKMLPVFRTDK